MSKGPRIIQITGVKGIVLSMFVVTCLIAGFVVFPAKVAEIIWNYAATNYIAIPQINLAQGVLLWAMTALSIYLLNNKKFAIAFHRPAELSDEEMNILMDRIKIQKQAQKLNSMILKSEEIKNIKDIEGIQVINKNTKTNEPSKQEDINQNIDEKKI